MSRIARKCGDWLENYLSLTDNTEPPQSFRMWVAISALAAVMQRKCWLEWSSPIYPNMYIVLVAPPGKARKGTAINPIIKMLQRLNIPLAAEAVTREALIRTLKESETQTPVDEGNLNVHSSLTVVSPELTVFIGYNNNTLLSDLTDWFDCRDKWVYRTKNSGTDEITGVFLNLLGATTPDLLRTTLPLDAIGGGLTSRMIFIYEADKGKKVPLPFITKKEKELSEKLYFDLELISRLQGEFKASVDFLSAYSDWYTNEADKVPFMNNKLAGYIERRPIHLLKLSQISSVSRGDDLILTAEDFNRAKILLTGAENGMGVVFGGIGANSYAHIMNKISAEVRLSKEPVPFSKLMSAFCSDIKITEFEEICKALQLMGYSVQRDQVGNKYLVPPVLTPDTE